MWFYVFRVCIFLLAFSVRFLFCVFRASLSVLFRAFVTFWVLALSCFSLSRELLSLLGLLCFDVFFFLVRFLFLCPAFFLGGTFNFIYGLFFMCQSGRGGGNDVHSLDALSAGRYPVRRIPRDIDIISPLDIACDILDGDVPRIPMGLYYGKLSYPPNLWS